MSDIRGQCDVGISVGIDTETGRPYVQVILDNELRIKYEVRAAMTFGALLIQAAGVASATHAAYEVLSDPIDGPLSNDTAIDVIHQINARRLRNEEEGRI